MKITDQITAPTRNTKAVKDELFMPEISEFLEHIQSRINMSFVGVDSPEGLITAPVGSTYHRLDGGANTSFYVKESGAGNLGWVGK